MNPFNAKLDAQDKKLEQRDEETKMKFNKLFAMMENLAAGHKSLESTTTFIVAGQDYTQSKKKHQKHGVDKNAFDENMQDRDTLQYRDNQASDDESDSLGGL
eukprot:11928084-Ditylum_brightwellii.AAC.1